MEGILVQVPQKHFIGMSFSGSFQTLVEGMTAHWGKFVARQHEIPLVIQPDVRYDISDENMKYRMFTEFVAVEVEGFERIPERMVAFTIPARTYARFTHRGPMSTVKDTYTQLFQWLSLQGLELDETAWRMERYDARYIPSVHAPDRPENTYEIFIPLKEV